MATNDRKNTIKLDRSYSRTSDRHDSKSVLIKGFHPSEVWYFSRKEVVRGEIKRIPFSSWGKTERQALMGLRAATDCWHFDSSNKKEYEEMSRSLKEQKIRIDVVMRDVINGPQVKGMG